MSFNIGIKAEKKIK